MNFNKLLDYNPEPAIESELAYLIIRIIEYNTNLYIKENNYSMRRFETLILEYVPYVNETLRTTGLYQELIEPNEANEEKNKEENYDAQEQFDALDIDDYEQDDDYDGAVEVLHGEE